MKQVTTLLLLTLLLCAPRAYCQIVYYNLSPGYIVLNTPGSQDIQIDSPINATLTNSQSVLTIREDSSRTIDVTAMNPNCEVMMQGSYPAALNAFQVISMNSSWAVPNNAILLNGSTGNWQNAAGKFLGVRIKEVGLWYYGWIRLNVNDTGNTATVEIIDYACNMEQGDSIYAGQVTGTGVNNIAAGNAINILYQGKKVNFSGTDGQAYDMILTDMSGRAIARYKYEGQAIDLSAYAAGIYVITLQNDKVRKRFKVLL